jgi:drug/metabolite transporter (DMT)-like permease
MVLAMIAWGSTWVSAKIMMEYLNAYELIFWRFFLSAMGLVPVILAMKHSWRVPIREAGVVLSAAGGLIAYNQFFFLGTHLGKAGLGGVLVTTLNPILTFVFLAILGRRLMKRREVTALILGAIGTLTILKVWSYSTEAWKEPGVVYFLAAAATWPWITILSSRLKEGSGLVLSFYMFLATTLGSWIVFLGGELPSLEGLDGRGWLNLLALSLYGTTFGTSVYFIASSRWGGARASAYFFLVPFSAMLFAALFLKEPVDGYTLIGGVMTLLAIYQLNGYNLLSFLRPKGWQWLRAR